MALSVLLSKDWIIRQAGGENVVALLLIVLVGALVYIAAILVLQRPLIMELYELLIKALGFDKRWPRLLPPHLRPGK